MNGFEEYIKIARLIAAEIGGVITPEEQSELEGWLNEDQQHPEIYQHILQRLQEGEANESLRFRPAVKTDWERVRKQMAKMPEKLTIWRSVYRYAAIVVLFLGVAFAFFLFKEEPVGPEVATVTPPQPIEAGSSKAVLTLANGKRMVLEETTTDSIQADGTLIEKKEGGLSYQQATNGVKDEPEVFNLINIPKGGEYKLILADGTKVWVNSASELKYPVKFVGATRTVYIKGEAYFEVAKNPAKPFIVKTTHQMEVKVLGTHFNVSAYEEDDQIATTLAEGKVVVSNGINSMNLEPNQQAVFEKKSEHFICRQVDANQYLSWKDGKFIFEEETLGEIMERLSRWYNIEVFFKENRTRDLRFSGDLEKYDDFSTVLRMLEKVSHIKVEIKDKTIFIEGK